VPEDGYPDLHCNECAADPDLTPTAGGGKKIDAINHLKGRARLKTAAIFALEVRERTLRDQLHASEEELSSKTQANPQMEGFSPGRHPASIRGPISAPQHGPLNRTDFRGASAKLRRPRKNDARASQIIATPGHTPSRCW
jgi:hypothetical protein